MMGQGEPQEVEVEQEQEPTDQIVSLDGSPVDDGPSPDQSFDGNLAEHIGDDELTVLASELILAVEEDLNGRKDWEDIYKDGLQYLGIKEEKRSTPWQGACGTTHPMILEAVVRYQSRAAVKLFPREGPAKFDVPISGPSAPQLQIAVAQAQRKFNQHLTRNVPELRDETDRLLFSQAQIGYAVKKVYYHEKLARVTTQFVPAEDFIIPYGYPNLETCPRYTEVIRNLPKSIVESRMRTGWYRQVDLQGPAEQLDQIGEKKAELTGQEPSELLDETVKLYEVHADLHIDHDAYGDSKGDTSPYIITIDTGSNQILCIRRGWREQDQKRKKRMAFVPYPFVPGDGSYAYGYIHLIGQIASTVTKLGRQLVDAGTLSNLPGGFKSKMARFGNTTEAIAPAEWRDVDLAPDELQKAFVPLPYKEPSQTLLTLMQGLVDEGKNFSSTADLDISASSQNAPVGTTLALLERQTEVSNAIQLRLHDAFRRELNLFVELLAEYEPDVYSNIFGQLEGILQGPVGVYPVGDPTSATLSQRVIQLQSVLQLSQQAPQVFDLPALFRTVLTAMGLEDVDNLVPDKSQLDPLDPVQETMAILTGKPVKAFDFQDHDAHLKFHSAIEQDPYYQQQLSTNPQAPQIMAAHEAHKAEHLAMQLRSQIQQQLGVPLPPLGKLPPQIEANLSALLVPAMQQLLQQHQADVQQQQAQQQAQDPMLQLEMQKLQIDAQDRQRKAALEQQRLQQERERDQIKAQLEEKRIAVQQQLGVMADQTKRDEGDLGRQQERMGQLIDFAQAKQQMNQEAVMTDKERQDMAAMEQAKHQRELQKAHMDHQHKMTQTGVDNQNEQQQMLMDHHLETQKMALQHQAAMEAAKNKPAPKKGE